MQTREFLFKFFYAVFMQIVKNLTKVKLVWYNKGTKFVGVEWYDCRALDRKNF